METFGVTVGVTNDEVRVLVKDLVYGVISIPVPAGEHLVVVELEDIRDGSRYFDRPCPESDVEHMLKVMDSYESVYEYIGQQCHIKCPRRHDDNTVFNLSRDDFS